MVETPRPRGEVAVPKCLATDGGVLAQFGSRRSEARLRFWRFVADGLERGSIWSGLRHQLYLGSEAFVERMRERLAGGQGDELSIPKAQPRAPTLSPQTISKQHPESAERDEAIVAAYTTGVFRHRETGEYFGLYLATVGRIIRQKPCGRFFLPTAAPGLAPRGAPVSAPAAHSLPDGSRKSCKYSHPSAGISDPFPQS